MRLMTGSKHCDASLMARTLHALPILLTLALGICLPVVIDPQENSTAGIGPKPLIEYFRPIPVSGKLSKDVWGAATVGPRDPHNALEDATIKQWDYWHGKLLRRPTTNIGCLPVAGIRRRA